MALSISCHKGILNKHFCKNLFEKNRMPVFLWRFEYGRRRLNSNNVSHWRQVCAHKLLEYYSSNQVCKIFSSTLTSYYIQSFLLILGVLSLHHWCFPGNVRIFERYTTTDLKITQYVRFQIKIIPSKFCILTPENSRVIHPKSLYFS